jgi:tellurite methyltransferase
MELSYSKYASITDFSKPTPFLVDALLNIPVGNALDIGCGNGRNALFLSKEGWKVYALDVDDEAINSIMNNAGEATLNIQIYREDIRTFKSDKKFDLIVCLMVLHFFTENDIKQVIKWMQDHTAPGGKNVISGFTDKNQSGTRPYLFKSDELTEYYKNWLIDNYEEADSSIQTLGGELSTYNVARLLATKI